MANLLKASIDVPVKIVSVFVGLLSLTAVMKGQNVRQKKKIVEISVNGSRIRDTASVFLVSTSTVIKELKKNKTSLKKSIEKP